MESGAICGFKDPRTVLAWPFWQRVFAGMPALRVVPLLLLRAPHEIAMSIFRRSQGYRDYAEALDVIAVHFRRMREIRDRWAGPQATVQFDPEAYRCQVQQASELCGLDWSDDAFAESYDASCRHHEAAVVDHPRSGLRGPNRAALASAPRRKPSATLGRRRHAGDHAATAARPALPGARRGPSGAGRRLGNGRCGGMKSTPYGKS